MIHDFTIIVWQEGRYFISLCLDLDISSFGETEQEARINIREAIEVSLEDAVIQNIRQPSIEHLTMAA